MISSTTSAVADLIRIVTEEKGIDPVLERLIELALTRAMLGRLGLGPRVLKWQSALELLTTC